MENNVWACPADIRCLLYEAGLFREDEDAVLSAGDFVVMERVCGERVSYRAVNIRDLSTRYLFARKTPLDGKQRRELAEKLAQAPSGMENTGRGCTVSGQGNTGRKCAPAGQDNAERRRIQLGQWHTEERMPDRKARAARFLRHVFEEILPGHGLKLRQNQEELSLEMLAALQGNKLALCEAEVGTGKTHAYILAVTVHNLFSECQAPAVISTSTIALQKAITEEYIPQISAILLEHRIIGQPLSFVVRKGKRHYVCDARLENYESAIHRLGREADRELLEALGLLKGPGHRRIDLDRAPLTAYVKERINVSRCGDNCPRARVCRFMNFQRKCVEGGFAFQIANHNYVLADLIGCRQGRKSLFPAYGALVLDEAHRLMEAVRQMYGTVWEEREIGELSRLAGVSPGRDRQTGRCTLLCGQLAEWNGLLFGRLAGELPDLHIREENCREVSVGRLDKLYLKRIRNGLEQLPQAYAGDMQGARLHAVRQKCEGLTDRVTVFINSERYICWMEKGDSGNLTLCAVPMELERELYRDLWSRRIPAIITSGTLSVRGDFSHFKKATGLELAGGRVCETGWTSPFDYRRQGLLYIPERMPFPNIRDGRYIRAIMEETGRIVRAAHGHTLVLFTSYWMMERIYYGLREELSEFPLFLMGRGRLDVIEAFRRSGNGVLFASDSAGEGIDLAGDILSCLIVVKLPFPVPSPVEEYQRELYGDFESYRREVIVPRMLIKLRQWFGRGIRRESDTAVFSILDSRAALRGRYRGEVLDTLPDMPVTDRLGDVEEFILRNKQGEYFCATEPNRK